jgi:hypothetical protein
MEVFEMARKITAPVALRVPVEAKVWLEARAETDWCSVNAIAVRVFRSAMAATEAEQRVVG